MGLLGLGCETTDLSDQALYLQLIESRVDSVAKASPLVPSSRLPPAGRLSDTYVAGGCRTGGGLQALCTEIGLAVSRVNVGFWPLKWQRQTAIQRSSDFL